MLKKFSYLLCLFIWLGFLVGCATVGPEGEPAATQIVEELPEPEGTDIGAEEPAEEVIETETAGENEDEAPEITTSASETERGVPAESLVEYPKFMSPNSQDTVVLKILALPDLVSVNPDTVSFARITPGAPPNVGELDYSRAFIMAAEEVLAQLVWQGQVVAGSADTKRLDITGGTPAEWVWVIDAPETLGFQTLRIDIFVAGDPNPTWQGFFQIEVVALATDTPEPTIEPSPTVEPSPTITPTPTEIPIIDQLTESLGNITTVITAIGTLVAAIVALNAGLKKLRGKDEEEDDKA